MASNLLARGSQPTGTKRACMPNPARQHYTIMTTAHSRGHTANHEEPPKFGLLFKGAKNPGQRERERCVEISEAMQRAATCKSCSWRVKSKGCKQCLRQWYQSHRLTEAAYIYWNELASQTTASASESIEEDVPPSPSHRHPFSVQSRIWTLRLAANHPVMRTLVERGTHA